MSTIAVACPECKKELNVPAELAGKKIRCKGCGATFPIQAKAQAKPAAKPKPAPAKAPEEGEGKFGFIEEDTKVTPRCPHCAGELDSEDAVICLHCGYNLRTRQKVEIKRVVETTPGDYFSHLLPGFVALIFIFLVIGFNLYYLLKLEDAVKGGDYEWLVYKGFKVWVVIFSLFFIFFAGKFAFRRLILNPRPEERQKG